MAFARNLFTFSVPSNTKRKTVILIMSCNIANGTSINCSTRPVACDKHVPKKVITSKNLSASYSQNISKSLGFTNHKKPPVKPKKTTRSDLTFSRKLTVKTANSIDYCKKCGDVSEAVPRQHSQAKKYVDNRTRCETKDEEEAPKLDRKPIQQYYKNENFVQSSESIHELADTKKPSLDTIKEVSELHSLTENTSAIFEICSDSEEEAGYLDVDKDENINRLREFRAKNYFECHSAKARIQNRGSVTSLQEHVCVYRFYLNDRLFPVPLSADHRDVIRCVQCHLPMDFKESINAKQSDGINGIIQAKVKLGNEIQDMTLLLPVKEPLIMRERKRGEVREQDEVYFGVIKLNPLGDSVFNRTLPSDSLALKYQKGYREHTKEERYRYQCQEKDDVIVI